MLKDYDVLLFPTYYGGEGFAGTLIDAFAAALPVIATDWHDNSEFIRENETGFLVDIKNANQIADKLNYIAEHLEWVGKMREYSRREFENYKKDRVIKQIINVIGEG